MSGHPAQMRLQEPLWEPDELALATGGEWIVPPSGDWMPTRVAYDIRSLSPGNIVVAKSPASWGQGSVDSSRRLDRVAASGSAAAIIEFSQLNTLPVLPPEFPLLLVDNTRRALDRLARASRSRFQGKVIAVTGTVGKTSTRNMLIHALNPQGGAVGSRGNNNNIPGVLRTLAYAPRDFGFVVTECGFGMPLNGLSISSLVARPHVAIITTISESHLNMFPGIDGMGDRINRLAHHKTMIFDGLTDDGIAIVGREMKVFDLCLDLARQPGRTVWTFGASEEDQGQLLSAELTATHSIVHARILDREVRYKLSVPGRHMAINSIGVLLAAAAAGADVGNAAESLSTYSPAMGRADVRKIKVRGVEATLIDDGFNAEPASVRSSLELLSLVASESSGRRVAVLRDIMRLGTDENAIHAALAESVLSNADKLITCGSRMLSLHQAVNDQIEAFHAPNLQALFQHILETTQPGDVLATKSGMGQGGLGDQGFLELARALRENRAFNPNVEK